MAADPKRVKELFVAALDLPEPSARQEFLDRECMADVGLRERVDLLLQAHDQPHPAVAASFVGEQTRSYQDSSTDWEKTGTIIAGKYKLLQQIGEGGMGSVWMAEQIEPVKRRVAIKLIRTERGSSKTILARFEAERQAIALMDHPNVAKLLDAGTTEAGQPFFVMELVKGVPLTDYCDAHVLTIPERLRLFVQICSAVQHAHQKGIIHRDLKPTNILVESHDGKPVPKVIDFGLAKAATGLQLTEHTLFTGFGTIMGTPLYMAPEQASFNAIDVDTRADVYALGAILYELLTGTTPITRDTIRKAAIDEMLRLIREQETPVPSSRLSSSGAKPSVAASRSLEPGKLGRIVRGELDWIVMKALAKERDRRYETASGFAKDVERYLNREPVLAGPPSVTYKLEKFVQRHKGLVVAASLVVLALAIGFVTTVHQAGRASVAEKAAWENARQEQKRRMEAARAEEIAQAQYLRAEDALLEARKQAREAEEQRKKAEQAEADTLADYRAGTDEAIEHLIGSKTELGPQERAYLEKTLQRWQAFALRQGDDERSLVIRGEGHFRIARLWHKLGRDEEAIRGYEVAAKMQKQLVQQYPEPPEYQQAMGRSLNNLAAVLFSSDKLDRALAEWKSVLAIRAKLVERFSDVPEYRYELARTHGNIGVLLGRQGRLQEACEQSELGLAMMRTLVERYPQESAYRAELVRIHNSLGSDYEVLGEMAKSQAELQSALTLAQKLTEEFPEDPGYAAALANIHGNVGLRQRRAGKHQEALASFHAARALQEKLIERFPSVPVHQERLAQTCTSLGSLLCDLGNNEDAWQQHHAARHLLEKLVQQFPRNLSYQRTLANCHCRCSYVGLRLAKWSDCVERASAAIQILDALPTTERALESIALRDSHWNRAIASQQLQRPSQAVQDWDRAIELSPPAEQPLFRARRLSSRLQAGMVAEALADASALAEMPNWAATQWYDFACVHAVASARFPDQRQMHAVRAMQLLQQAVQAGYKNAKHAAKDSDLDSLRDREDFKKLLAELEAKAARE